jgi:hypothetical protein
LLALRSARHAKVLYKTELIKPRKPWRTIEEVELAIAEWVDLVQPPAPLPVLR